MHRARLICRNQCQGKLRETNLLPFLLPPLWLTQCISFSLGSLEDLGRRERKLRRALRDSHLVSSIPEQLGCRQPPNPCAHHDHVRRVSRGLQPVLGNLQQLLVVLVTETILREAREPLGAQDTRQQEDLEEDWEGKKRREGNNAGLALKVIADGTDKDVDIQDLKRGTGVFVKSLAPAGPPWKVSSDVSVF